MVTDDEILYRRLRAAPSDCYSLVEGKTRFSSTAFNDPSYKVSVDRAILRASAEESKVSPTDGIVSLVTLSVRSIAHIATPEGDKYAVDVLARPIEPGNPEGDPANPAHAQIEASPDFVTSSRFKKLKEALAILATQNGWLIEPS